MHYLERVRLGKGDKVVDWGVVELDDIQWAITRSGRPISFHVFSGSLKRRWTELTGQSLLLDLPKKRGQDL